MESITVVIPGIGPIQASKASPIPLSYRGLRTTLDERQKFWIGRVGWPRDALGKVFLGNAVHQLGPVMFPGEWTGHEPGVNELIQPLPHWASQATNSERFAAVSALGRARPKDESAEQMMARIRGPVDQDTWGEAVALREETLAALAGPRKRWIAVRTKLADALLDGVVKYYVRTDETGDFSKALPPQWWNTESGGVAARFYTCKMNTLKPITFFVDGSKYWQWVFVDSDDLAALLSSVVQEHTPPTSLHRRAEYLGVLLSAVKESPGRNPFTRNHWEQRARAEYRLPRDEFDKVWAEALSYVPGNRWREPGRRPKKSSGS